LGWWPSGCWSPAKQNEAALADSTRLYRSATDSTRTAYLRLALQYKHGSTRLSASLTEALKKLHAERKAVTDLTLTIQRLNARDTSHQTVTDSGRSALLNLPGPPITGTVGVRLPSDSTQPAQWQTNLGVSPLTLTYTLNCAKDDAPVVAVDAPSWATVQMKASNVDPTVCHGKRPTGFSLFSWHPGFHSGVGVALALTKDGFRPALVAGIVAGF
jgi:hypothetical protein